ncbi:hypothetical protein BMF94_4447 [Rhodotorula taiwanensis]|uniref:NAD(P)-binding protein n=1 Tax=Rhodotorula taiwanensis TaxID=741276 RepID=A0A2S5B772_9BASI|nr:hypothetical protein BMF94_4447 [Rhodotorula taiwanensis]
MVWPFSSLASKAGFSNGRHWEPETGLADLTGKVAAITGANEGIGFITAQELHKKGCKIFLLCRNEEKAQNAIDRLNKTTPGQSNNLVFVKFDLTDIPSAKAAAEAIQAQTSRLDILVNNAGIMAWPYEVKNGVEIQFSNHVGHFALTTKLLPLMIQTSKEPGSSVRIVNVSSKAHEFSPKPDFSSIEAANQEMKNTWQRYGQSKLANVLFTTALQERVQNEKIYVNTLHPGNIATTLTRGPSASYGKLVDIMEPLWKMFGMTPFAGAKTQLYLAGSPEVEEKNYRGQYFVPIATPGDTTDYAKDRELAEQLWKLSEEIVSKA